jgi:hypothetical protein
MIRATCPYSLYVGFITWVTKVYRKEDRRGEWYRLLVYVRSVGPVTLYFWAPNLEAATVLIMFNPVLRKMIGYMDSDKIQGRRTAVS